jgi:uncharacterized protein YuzE
MIKIHYDSEGDILEIKFADDKIEDSEYSEQNGVVLDYDKAGKLVGLELISFSKRVKKPEEITAWAI